MANNVTSTWSMMCDGTFHSTNPVGETVIPSGGLSNRYSASELPADTIRAWYVSFPPSGYREGGVEENATNRLLLSRTAFSTSNERRRIRFGSAPTTANIFSRGE